MKYKLLFTFVVILCAMNLTAQNTAGHEEEHEHHKNDIGIANSAVFLPGEKEFAYGLDAHYIRNIKSSDFGIGIGFEKIFGEHDHTTIGIVGQYRPMDDCSINLSPGLLLKEMK